MNSKVQIIQPLTQKCNVRLWYINCIVRKIYAEKEGSTLLQPKNRCMKDACPCSYEQHVLVGKHVYTYKCIMITFPEN